MRTSSSIGPLIVFGLLAYGIGSGCRARPAERKLPAPGCMRAIEESDGGKYRGFLTWGREEGAFIPCDCDDIWWVKYNKGAVGQVHAARRNSGCYEAFGNPACDEWIYAELSGDVSPTGRYGHMGWYHRELRVDQIDRLSQGVPSTCNIRRITSR